MKLRLESHEGSCKRVFHCSKYSLTFFYDFYNKAAALVCKLFNSFLIVSRETLFSHSFLLPILHLVLFILAFFRLILSFFLFILYIVLFILLNMSLHLSFSILLSIFFLKIISSFLLLNFFHVSLLTTAFPCRQHHRCC